MIKKNRVRKRTFVAWVGLVVVAWPHVSISQSVDWGKEALEIQNIYNNRSPQIAITRLLDSLERDNKLSSQQIRLLLPIVTDFCHPEKRNQTEEFRTVLLALFRNQEPDYILSTVMYWNSPANAVLFARASEVRRDYYRPGRAQIVFQIDPEKIPLNPYENRSFELRVWNLEDLRIREFPIDLGPRIAIENDNKDALKVDLAARMVLAKEVGSSTLTVVNDQGDQLCSKTVYVDELSFWFEEPYYTVIEGQRKVIKLKSKQDLSDLSMEFEILPKEAAALGVKEAPPGFNSDGESTQTVVVTANEARREDVKLVARCDRKFYQAENFTIIKIDPSEIVCSAPTKKWVASFGGLTAVSCIYSALKYREGNRIHDETERDKGTLTLDEVAKMNQDAADAYDQFKTYRIVGVVGAVVTAIVGTKYWKDRNTYTQCVKKTDERKSQLSFQITPRPTISCTYRF